MQESSISEKKKELRTDLKMNQKNSCGKVFLIHLQISFVALLFFLK